MSTTPGTPSPDNAITLLIGFLDQAFDHPAWHGPNLRGALRRVSAQAACWRPAPNRHGIAEHALHAAYWKYTVRRRLTGEKRGSFARKGSDWFDVPDDLAEPAWRDILRLLDDEHRALRRAVAHLETGRLGEIPPGSRFSIADLIAGAAAHDIYHAGQIQLLKRLQKTAFDPRNPTGAT